MRPSHRCTSTAEEVSSEKQTAAARWLRVSSERPASQAKTAIGTSCIAAPSSDLPATSANSTSAGTCAHAMVVIARWRLLQFSGGSVSPRGRR